VYLIKFCPKKEKTNGKIEILAGNAGNCAGIREDGCWVIFLNHRMKNVCSSKSNMKDGFEK